MQPICDDQSLDLAEDYLDSLSPLAQRNGLLLYKKRAIEALVWSESEEAYAGQVLDRKLHAVTLKQNGSRWGSLCSCGKTGECGHAAAMMIEIVNRVAAEEMIEEVGAPPARKTATKGAKPAKAASFKERAEEALKRKLKPDERRFAEKIQILHQTSASAGAFTLWSVQEAGLPWKGSYYETIAPWPEYPKDVWEFWLYIARESLNRNVAIPPFLAPVTDFAPIEEKYAQWARKKEIAQWTQALGAADLNETPARPPEMDLRLLLDRDRARLESRLHAHEPFRAVKAGDVNRLVTEMMRGSMSVVPDAYALWTACVRPARHEIIFSLRYEDEQFRSRLNDLLRMPATASRILTSDGAAFIWMEEPLRWETLPPANEGGDYVLTLKQANGAPLPEPFLILPGNPRYYLTEGAIWKGPPSHPSLHPSAPNRIPAAALETGDGFRVLRHLQTPLPQRMQDRIKTVRMKVRVSCEAKPSCPGSSVSYLNLRAAAEGKGAQREVWSPDGWQKDWTDKEKSKSDDYYAHDRSLMEQFNPLTRPLGLKWESYSQTARLKITKTFPEIFSAWLASLPQEIDVKLDKELASLTEAPVEAQVRLECQDAGVDWFDLKVIVDVQGAEFTPEELKLLLDARGKFVRLEGKGWRRLNFNLTEEEDERLARLGLTPHDFTSEPQRLHALQLSDKAASRLLPEPQAVRIQRRAEEIKTRVSPPLPSSIRAQLRPYQVEGFHFLAYLSANRFGGVLADDMGLGKTLQTLAWLAWLRETEAAGPCLIVCPKSVMDNWRTEAERFYPGLRVTLWKGAREDCVAEAAAASDLLVTNYTQFRLLAESLAAIQWQAAILDEGQYIKNPESQAAKAARSLKAGHRLVLSGTPIENRLLDLWSLMSFAMPGVLGNRAQFVRLFDKTTDPLARRRLAARLRPFLLRRTKDEVAQDLPDRVEEDIHCEIEGEQKTLYRAELKKAQRLLLGIETMQQLNEQRFNFLTSLLRLRQICCHPALINEKLASADSAKLNALMELLEPLMEQKNKVLVFSQFVTMLDIIRDEVTKRGWKHFYLAGSTENRGGVVSSFQSCDEPAVFLISLKAGGFGLNLTASSYVVLYDPWWNPAVENQAIDRAHRIGQTSKVIAYRLLVKDSIEQKIRLLQKQKSALAQDVLGEEGFAQGLTLDDLKFLLSGEGLEGGSQK